MLRQSARQLAFLPLLFVLSVQTASADIIQSVGPSGVFFARGDTIFGQSFRADQAIESLETISFWFLLENTASSVQPIGTLTLFRGVGYTPNPPDQLATVTRPFGFTGDHWLDFDLTGFDIRLTPGEDYSFRIHVPNQSRGGYAAVSTRFIDYYPGGTFLGRSGQPLETDLRFRVLGSPIPEPSTALLLAVGLAGVALVPGRLAKRRAG